MNYKSHGRNSPPRLLLTRIVLPTGIMGYVLCNPHMSRVCGGGFTLPPVSGGLFQLFTDVCVTSSPPPPRHGADHLPKLLPVPGARACNVGRSVPHCAKPCQPCQVVPGPVTLLLNVFTVSPVEARWRPGGI
ncbi:unnamed protein product [Pleuronectes platessa]|uniref:Uncharacterized protein n=1 Tax=Pleuronectes platessa TaxID=8262 RepID=A0A9N7TL83_PLEPL|nr:unnamed protein product [Pleuronectes platessa]